MIGIVILNYENWDDTRCCIESICKNPPQEEYRIILVDNASKRQADDFLKRMIRQHEIIFIQNEKNAGYNAGNNRGIMQALSIGCDFILISNNDVYYLEDSIQNLCNYLKANPQVGIAGPKILNAQGQVQKCCLCRKTGLKEKYLVRTRMHTVFRKSWRTYFGHNCDYDQIFDVYAVLGCCFMMSGRCARAVTPLDEYPFLYEEELILGIRMEQTGFRTVYNPDAVIRHIHGASTKYRRAFSFAQNIRSEIYYCRSYLEAAKWQIYPLYVYRELLYLARCTVDKDYRKNWGYFRRLTKQEMQKAGKMRVYKRRCKERPGGEGNMDR